MDEETPAGLPTSAPAVLRLSPDASVRVHDDGRTLIGGSPWRILRLTGTGAERVREWWRGEPVPDRPMARALARRLTAGGMAHPWWSSSDLTPADVTAIIPVKDDSAGVRAICAALHGEVGAIIVVDDGSAVPVRPPAGVQLLRHEEALGPAAARNTGRQLVATALVAFLDADVEPQAGWLDALLPHFNDEQVVAVAPRVRSAGGPSALERYEQLHSPLDLGLQPARVAPRTRVAYVPTACLVIRADSPPFDTTMRYGEDVDLVWRLIESGSVVRYEPAAVVDHRPRSTLGAFAQQRFYYASASAPLAKRHPGAVVPVAISAWSAGAWALAAFGRPVMGFGTAAVSTGLLTRKLGGLPHPAKRAVGLAGRGHLGAGRQLASAMTRSWWPVILAGALASGRVRRVAVAAAVVPPLLDWWAQRPRLDPIRYGALRLFDDASYGAGLWTSCVRERTLAPLLPDLGSWPGRDRPGQQEPIGQEG